jgi:hypothetical protein
MKIRDIRNAKDCLFIEQQRQRFVLVADYHAGRGLEQLDLAFAAGVGERFTGLAQGIDQVQMAMQDAVTLAMSYKQNFRLHDLSSNAEKAWRQLVFPRLATSA